MRPLIVFMLFCLPVLSPAEVFGQAHPRDGEIHDADTLAWWHTTEDLSGDAMEGRDTGSPAYDRAALYVANRFKRAGLQPAGDAGSAASAYFQKVAMHEVAVAEDGTSFSVMPLKGAVRPLRFLEEITINPVAGMAAVSEAELVFRGYCGKDGMSGVAGKFVICFGTQRQGLPGGGERAANVRAAGGVGVVTVDDMGFTIEPPRWPAAYARSVSLGEAPATASAASPLLGMRVSVEAFSRMIEGSGQDAAAILAAGGRKESLPAFDVPAKLGMKLNVTQRSYSSSNIVGVLPGTDPVLKNEYIVVSAHLDGYGYGTPVLGDKLYNGALDDAAYTALLIQFADDLKSERRALKRSVLFCAFTGEEKGLLGANYFVEHPTVPLAQFAADVNLDQLRPLFPLHLLTALAIDDTSLGQSAKAVGGPMGIKFQADPEPERGLLRRADHYPFLRVGVPAIGFIFGYEPGTEAERRYREWYRVRYHRPQDDLTQPMDFEAAGKFDRFFYRLVEVLADDAQRPAFNAGSGFRK